MKPENCLRVSEWSAIPVNDLLEVDQREAIEEASEIWRVANGFPHRLCPLPARRVKPCALVNM